MGLVENVQQAKGECADDLAGKLLLLIGELVWGCRVGKETKSTREIAGIVGVDHRQFDKNRRWGRIRADIEKLFNEWDQEVIDAGFGDKN